MCSKQRRVCSRLHQVASFSQWWKSCPRLVLKRVLCKKEHVDIYIDTSNINMSALFPYQLSTRGKHRQSAYLQRSISTLLQCFATLFTCVGIMSKVLKPYTRNSWKLEKNIKMIGQSITYTNPAANLLSTWLPRIFMLTFNSFPHHLPCWKRLVFNPSTQEIILWHTGCPTWQDSAIYFPYCLTPRLGACLSTI